MYNQSRGSAEVNLVKTWKIPIYRRVMCVEEIVADSLEEAIMLAKLHQAPDIKLSECAQTEPPQVPNDEDYLRWSYNNGQNDEEGE